MKRIIIAVFLIMLAVAPGYATAAVANTDSFVVQDIQFEGLQRISSGTVLNYLPIQVGQRLQPQDSTKIIRALYKTGFFSYVSLDRRGDTLVVVVKERPTIGDIQVTGNKEMPTEVLLDSLKSLGVAEGRVYDKSVVEGVRESLQNQYYDRGNYNAKVTVNTVAETQNRVGIRINISEGMTATIKQINIIGNQDFSEKKLIKVMGLETSKSWSFLTKKDQYSKEKLDAGLEELRSFYLDDGYIQFEIESTQVSITPNRQEVYVVVRIKEGPQYRVKGYDITGTMVVPKEKLQELVNLQPGDVFSRKKITQTTSDIGNYLGNYGYTFASVTPVPEVDEETHEVYVTFLIEPGKRTYVRRIVFYGNTKTEDHVLRREMRQQEAALASVEQIRLSERRLNMLGFFKNVGVNTKRVPGTDDEVDLEFHVVEAPSASLSFSIGYSDTDKFLINAGFNQPNFLGSGNALGINFNSTRYIRNYSISFFDPYYTTDGIGRGVSIYATTMDYDDSEVSSYTANQYGGNVYYSFPMSERSSFSLGYGYQLTTLSIPSRATPAQREAAYDVLLNPNSTPEERNEASKTLYRGTSLELEEFKDKYGERFNNFLLTAGWSFVNLDRAIFPTKGFAQYTDVVLALPLTSDSIAYYKANYSAHYYQPLFAGFILSLRGEVGYGDGIFGDSILPFYENYYAGGVGIQGGIRGYKGYTVGPKDSRGNNLGGNFLLDGTVSLILPLPFAKDTLRTSLFVDAGNVYTNIDPIVDPFTPIACDQNPGPIRLSTGVAAEWRSPMGPLIFSLATPLNKQRCDEPDRFQFTVGTAF